MNPLEVLARLIADLYQQIAELKAQLEAKEAEIDAIVRQAEGHSINREAEEIAKGQPHSG